MRSLPLFALLVGCGGQKATPVAECSHPARAAAVPVIGDHNGDGVTDIADAIYMCDYVSRAGPAPVCAAAADVMGDDLIDLGQGTAILYHDFVGNTTYAALAAGACALPTDPGAACAGDLALTLDASSATAGTATVTVSVQSPELALQGWALSVAAEGCRVTGASTAGTQAADRRDSPPGVRDGGFQRTDLTGDGGAVDGTVLDLHGTAVLPASPDAQPILALTVQAISGCTACTVRIQDGLVGAGAPITNVLVAGGHAYLPGGGEVSVGVCGG